MFKEDIRKEKQAKKCNFCLRCWLRHSWVEDLKHSRCSDQSTRNLKESHQHWLGYLLSAAFYGFYITVTKETMCMRQGEGKRTWKEEPNMKAFFPLPFLPLPNSRWLRGGPLAFWWRWSSYNQVDSFSLSWSGGFTARPFSPHGTGEDTSLILAVNISSMSRVFQLVVICGFTASLEIPLLELSIISALLFVVFQ